MSRAQKRWVERQPDKRRVEDFIERPKIRVTPDGRTDAKGAADYIGAALQTMAQWRSEGRGPRYIKIGSRVFYYLHVLDEYVASCHAAE